MRISILEVLMNLAGKRPISFLKEFPQMYRTTEFFHKPRNSCDTASPTEFGMESAGKTMSNVPRKDFQNASNLQESYY